MATFTLFLNHYRPTAPFYPSMYNMIGVPTTELSDLIEIAEYYIATGQADGGVIALDSTGEVIVYWENGEMVVAG